MRIAIFHNLPPGGAKRVVYESVRRTADRHDYELYRIDLGNANRWPESRSVLDVAPFVRAVHEYRLRSIPRAVPAVGALHTEQCIRVQLQIARDIDNAGFDLVFVHHDQFTSTPALLEHLRTPSVYYCQEPRRRSFEFDAAAPYSRSPLGLAWRQYDRSLRRRDIEWARAASTILCNSTFSAEAIRRGYGRTARVCYLGVDEEVFHPGTAARRHAVLSVGALDEPKCHGLVVDAVGRLPSGQRPAVDVVFERVNDAQRTALIEKARAGHVELRLHAGITDRQLADLYRTALATICAARLEPFGLTTLESLSCGTPVVAVREGGFREVVVDGHNGLLVERDVTQLAQAIEAVATGRARWSAEHLRESVIPFWSWDSAARRLLECLDDAVTPRRPPNGGGTAMDTPALAGVHDG